MYRKAYISKNIKVMVFCLAEPAVLTAVSDRASQFSKSTKMLQFRSRTISIVILPGSFGLECTDSRLPVSFHFVKNPLQSRNTWEFSSQPGNVLTIQSSSFFRSTHPTTKSSFQSESIYLFFSASDRNLPHHAFGHIVSLCILFLITSAEHLRQSWRSGEDRVLFTGILTPSALTKCFCLTAAGSASAGVVRYHLHRSIIAVLFWLSSQLQSKNSFKTTTNYG